MEFELYPSPLHYQLCIFPTVATCWFYCFILLSLDLHILPKTSLASIAEFSSKRTNLAGFDDLEFKASSSKGDLVVDRLETENKTFSLTSATTNTGNEIIFNAFSQVSSIHF